VTIPKAFALDQDAAGERHALGPNFIDFKVLTRQTGGGLFVIENVCHEKGGPPLHLHPDQDEWFYSAEGEFAFEVGGAKSVVARGGSILGPRGVPHAWAFTRGEVGRLVIAFTPAGKMEEFFREATKSVNPASLMDPAVWLAHGMQLLGPPLAL